MSSETEPERVRVRLVVHGRVQGVGYRAWTASQARALGLGGFVRNRVDGAVEIEAEGSRAVLTSFVSSCRRGPLLANVTDVESDDAPPRGDSAFEIVR